MEKKTPEYASPDDYLKFKQESGTRDAGYEWSIVEPLITNGKYEEALSWLDRGFTFTHRMKQELLKTGDLRVYQSLYKWGLRITDYVIRLIITSGNLETLEWIQTTTGASEYPINISSDQIFKLAVEYGQVDLVQKFLPKLDAISLRNYYNRAFRRGHVKLVQWFADTYPDLVILDGSIAIALERGNFDVIYWLIGRDSSRIKPVNLVIGGYLTVLQWIYDQKIFLDLDTLVETAIRNDQKTILDWLYDLESPRM